MAKRKFIGEMLVDAGLLTPEQLEKALEHQKSSGMRLGQALVSLGLVTEEGINETLGKQVGIPYVDLDTYLIDRKVVELIPEKLAREFRIFPLFKIAGTLTLAMADPLDVRAIDEARIRSGCEVEAAIAGEKQILRAIEAYYGVSGSFDNIVEEISDGDLEAFSDTGIAAEEAPIIRLVNIIIQQAVHENASDIHIEPDEKKLRVRYRLDGILTETRSPPKRLQAAIVSRIKVMARMDIAETRIPQDGRLQLAVDEREVEFRVSSFPTIYGENIVMRVLDQSKTILNLEELGFPAPVLSKYKNMLTAPYGIILVTGPTGSGKTTTLYGSLNAINSMDRNIITLEDPVEYRLPLIRQTQINPKAGLTFASGLRSILRQDPDIIMVGEMRDLETAEIAFQAALTGHLVFSTLHTNDAAGALARLLHLGIEPFLVASSTVGVIAQRLVRTICPNCRTSFTPSRDVLQSFRLDNGNRNEFFVGKGCKACRSSGYRGRTGIYETLRMDDHTRQLVLRNASVEEIRESARKHQGMSLLREEGLKRAKEGVTTLEEVGRLTAMDE